MPTDDSLLDDLRSAIEAGTPSVLGLAPVFGVCSISSYSRGLSRLCPSDSTCMGEIPLSPELTLLVGDIVNAG